MTSIAARPTIKDSRILVTGGAGFVGSNLVDRLQDEGAKEVLVIDNLFCGREDNLEAAIERGAVLYKDDAEIATSLEYIFDRHEIDIVFNCATKALNYSFVNPANAFEMNVHVALNLLELQRKGRFRTLCHFSSSEVYGSAVYEPMDELHPRNPTTAYAAGKAAADLAVETYVRMFGLDAFIVRPFNNYGPRQNYRGFLAAVIPLTAYRIYRGIVPELYGSGDQSRDFIFIEDTVDAIVKIFPFLPAGESVNISTDGQVRIRDVIEKVCALMGYSGQIVKKESRSSDVFCHNASNKKIKAMIDYRLTSFDEGMQKTIEWYKASFAGRRP
jgi:dTDP-D-glucose 4,6-dehydratase